MVFWRGAAFRVRPARARRGASVPFGERMRVWGRARLSRFPLSNLPSPFVQNFYPYRISLFDVPRGRKYGGGEIVLLERNGFLEGGGFSGAPRLCALGGMWTGALPRRKESSALPVRVGGVSVRVVSVFSRACRDSTTVRGVRAFGRRRNWRTGTPSSSWTCPCVWGRRTAVISFSLPQPFSFLFPSIPFHSKTFAFIEWLCHRKWLMLYSLKCQRNNQ